jgi:hypothetical protein
MSEIMLVWTSSLENVNLSEMNCTACEGNVSCRMLRPVYLYTNLKVKLWSLYIWLKQRRHAKIMYVLFFVEYIVLGARMGKI